MIPLKWFGRHPRPAHLHRYADGELTEPALSRVRFHLETCADCRGRVAFYSELRATAGQMPAPVPPGELLEDILASREAGERVILPVAAVPVRQAVPLRALAAAAVLVIALGVSLIFTSQAGAGASDLVFEPSRPGLGNLLELEYRPATLLAGDPTLRVRARYRLAEGGAASSDRAGRLLTFELSREDDGMYRGTLRLPPSAVYVAFAVEDTVGERVDANGSRLWELLVHGAEDRPLLEALVRQYDDLEDRNWRAATESARRTADLYPDRAEGWSMLLEHEVRVLEGPDMEARIGEHREIFARLKSRALASPEASASELAALGRYARLLGDRDAEQSLARILQARYPGHPAAIQARVLEEVEGAPDSRGKLEVLEAEWQRSGTAAEVVPDVGFTIAASLGDPEVMLRWADRLSRTGLEGAADAAVALAGTPSLRSVGIQHLRDVIGRIEQRPDAERALHESRSEFRDRRDAWVRSLQGHLARALMDAGNVEDGLDLLARAAAGGWDPEVFRTAAEAELVAGDTSGALTLTARVAVDPLVRTAWVDSMRSLLGGRARGTAWEDLLAEARVELAQRVGTGPMPARPFPDGITVRSAAGAADLDGLLQGRTTLVAFWHRHSWPFLEDLENLDALNAAYEGRDLQLLTVSVEPIGPGLEEFLRSHATDLPVLFDTGDTAARTLGVWSTPEYVVVDRTGRIRVRTADLGRAARVAESLEQEASRPG